MATTPQIHLSRKDVSAVTPNKPVSSTLNTSRGRYSFVVRVDAQNQ